MMKSEGLGKILIIGFLLALLLYAASFAWIQHNRESKGPWQIAFVSDAAGQPSVIISQSSLNIQNCKITFPEQHIDHTNLASEVSFDRPTTNAPFGEIVFQDPTFLPGSVTFNFWGHGIELMPRTLIIDKQEVPWSSNTNIVLQGEGKFERRPIKKRAVL
jgi:hypothetical protein